MESGTEIRLPLAPAIARIIEDAILFGHVRELDSALDIVAEDEDFPPELRQGLEALRHFRAHYGKDGVAPPKEGLQRQKVIVFETSWGSELLDMLRQAEANNSTIKLSESLA